MYGSFKLTQRLYKFIMIVIWTSYIAALYGVVLFNPIYINMLDTITKTFIALFLTIRFNPFTNIIMTKFDKQIAWSAGVFLLLTSTLTATIKLYFNSKILQYV